MIDWLTIDFPPLSNAINDGMVVFYHANGDVDYGVDKFLSYQGSHDSSCQIRGTSSELTLRGNPAKFLQGHNLFGTSDFSSLLRSWLLALRPFLGFDDLWFYRVMRGEFKVKRIDITYNYRLKDRGDVIAWINAVKQVGSSKRQHVSPEKGDTVYFGKGSKRSLVKFYDKEGELMAHPVSGSLHPHEVALLSDYARGLLRCEVQLRTMSLKDEFKLVKGRDFLKLGEKELRGVFMKKLGAIRLPDTTQVRDDMVQELIPRHKGPYMLWQEGHVLRECYARATAFRYRKEFLEMYGVDIFLPFPDKEIAKTARVIPLLRPLEAIPEAVPKWAYELKLIAA